MDLFAVLSKVPDPRIDRRKLYPLPELLGIALCAVLAGAEDFTEMAQYGQEKEVLLKTLFELKNGIPAHDTFNRVFRLLDPAAFAQVLHTFAAQLIDQLAGQHLCIDGKGICGTSLSGQSGNTCLTILTAWLAEHRLAIAQRRVEQKSNEITAIPELLKQLDLTGSIVSIDAMGCQKNVADQIATAQATYLLGVKANQGMLLKEITDFFEQKQATLPFDKQFDVGHGRIETRICQVSTDLTQIHMAPLWKDLTTIIKVSARREYTYKAEVNTSERYYICNASLTPAQANQYVRRHWSVENELHWQLDVTFREDQATITNRRTAQNMNLLRKLALQMIEQEQTTKRSKKAKRKKAAWNDQYLLDLIKNFKLNKNSS